MILTLDEALRVMWCQTRAILRRGPVLRHKPKDRTFIEIATFPHVTWGRDRRGAKDVPGNPEIVADVAIMAADRRNLRDVLRADFEACGYRTLAEAREAWALNYGPPDDGETVNRYAVVMDYLNDNGLLLLRHHAGDFVVREDTGLRGTLRRFLSVLDREARPGAWGLLDDDPPPWAAELPRRLAKLTSETFGKITHGSPGPEKIAELLDEFKREAMEIGRRILPDLQPAERAKVDPLLADLLQIGGTPR